MLLFEDPVFASRMLSLLTLSIHAIFATLGVGLPLMIIIAHWLGIKKNDEHYLLMARRWARGFVVLVAVGVVTGTAIALQLALLWPNFMEMAGHVIALPLFMEVFAFFFEAIFLGIYLYTWNRFDDQRKHLLLLIPVAIGATMSAFFITTVNGFMNAPTGFQIIGGQMTGVSPIEAMFNPATPTKAAHVISTAFMTSAFVLAALAAYRLLKGAQHVYYKKALHLMMVVGLIFAIATAVIGDFAGKYLAKHQPEKLAAAEWHFETMEGAPLVLFGILDDEQNVRFGLEIPYALSILAHNHPQAEVIGLNEFPQEWHPPLFIHYLFDLMVIIGVWLVLFSFVYWWGMRRKWTIVTSRWFRRLIVASGPLAMLAIQAGWWMTEFGRQPWILRGVMTVEEAATQSPYVGHLFFFFLALYLILVIGVVVVLRNINQRFPLEQDLAHEGGERPWITK
ncbi:cytochrome bd ubiquinol oxidase subunit I [Caldalkalibacillus thermarum TA2.A1]|uniref:Cytochrome bd ubiquinol oxidase subunit I n=1 Tax=Caldalkalibacillus thermarum (strain TA2.A1) TaxID=986075 RepID=F5L8J5_CALTT|nr:cytochrome bd ubiquinol oxidase subunit I [Caldalkalibacillus thermarum TA2.A1]